MVLIIMGKPFKSTVQLFRVISNIFEKDPKKLKKKRRFFLSDIKTFKKGEMLDKVSWKVLEVLRKSFKRL